MDAKGIKEGAAAGEKLRERIRAVAEFYRQSGRMPSFAEVGRMVGLHSKNAVFKLIGRMEEAGAIGRDANGRLLPRSIANPLRVLGAVEAGFPSPAEEELADTVSLDSLLVQNPEATFMLRVSGDSMNGAGILPGDMVLVDRARTPKSGDIVVAEVDGQWTMKYLKKRGTDVTLIAANPAYKPIRPKRELKVAGVVTSVIRKYL